LSTGGCLICFHMQEHKSLENVEGDSVREIISTNME
jgi:hypothetical protein